MARQKSIIKLQGTIGDITFTKTKDGYLARERTSVSGKRIATDPAFQRTRENNAEFGRAGRAGKILRSAFRGQLLKASDGRMVSRLTKAMLRVIQADSSSVRGSRNVLDGETELLEGFNFNQNGSLATTLFAPFTATIDRLSGELSVSLPAFVPLDAIAAPKGATHVRFFTVGAAVNFEGGSYESNSKESDLLALATTATGALVLRVQVTPNNTHPLFLSLGIEFLQAVNSGMYSLNNGVYNAMAIVKVSGL